jgi:hypothetical protein
MRKANPAHGFSAQLGGTKAKPYLLLVKGMRAFLIFTLIAPLLLTTGRINAQTHVEHAYQACLEKASAAHDTAWAAECKRIAEERRQNHDACISELKLPKSFCDASYKPHDVSPNCRLWGRLASVLNADLQHARRRCMHEKHPASWHGIAEPCRRHHALDATQTLVRRHGVRQLAQPGVPRANLSLFCRLD